MNLSLINSSFNISTHKAKERTMSKDTLMNQVIDEQNKGKNIIAAINGDFFNLENGIPSCHNIINNEIFSTSISKKDENLRPCFAILENNQIDIDHYYFDGYVCFEHTNFFSTPIKIDSLNRNDYIENTINVFNKKNNEFSTIYLPIEKEDALIILIKPDNMDSNFYNNNKIHGKVCNIIHDPPNYYKISDDEIAIVAYNDKKQLFSNLKVGIQTTFNFKIQKNYEKQNSSKVKHLLTGHEFILYNNYIPDENYFSLTWNNSAVYSKNHRTALGITDRNTLIIVSVDKKDSFLGMNLPDLGEYLKSLGAYKAINLDGGGSTNMMIRNLGYYQLSSINLPRENRHISNSIMITNTLPYVEEIRQLYYFDSRQIKTNEHRQLNFIAVDINLNPVNIYLNPNLKLSSDIGYFDKNGTFYPNNNPCKGNITIEIDNIIQTYEIEII